MSINVSDFAPGSKLSFQGFVGSPPAAIFTVERHDDGIHRLVDVLHVPIPRWPKTTDEYHRTRRWVTRKVLAAFQAGGCQRIYQVPGVAGKTLEGGA